MRGPRFFGAPVVAAQTVIVGPSVGRPRVANDDQRWPTMTGFAEASGVLPQVGGARRRGQPLRSPLHISGLAHSEDVSQQCLGLLPQLRQVCAQTLDADDGRSSRQPAQPIADSRLCQGDLP